MAFTLFSDLLGWNRGSQYVERSANDMTPATANTTNTTNTVNLAQASTDFSAQAAPAVNKGYTPSNDITVINQDKADYLRNFITRYDIEYSGYATIAKSKRGADFSAANDYRDGGKHVPYEIFDDIINVRRSILEERIGKIVEVNRWFKSSKEVVPPDERWVKSKEHEIYHNLDHEVAAKVKKLHHARGGASTEILDKELNTAFKAVENEVPGKGGLINSIIEPFYNKDGVRLGGIGGAGLGLLMASMLIPDTGWLGNLAKVLFVFLGAYAGNKFVDSLPSSNRFASLSTEGVKQAERSQGLEQQQKIDSPPAKNKVTDVNLNGANIAKVGGGTTVTEAKPQLFAVTGQQDFREKPRELR